MCHVLQESSHASIRTSDRRVCIRPFVYNPFGAFFQIFQTQTKVVIVLPTSDVLANCLDNTPVVIRLLSQHPQQNAHEYVLLGSQTLVAARLYSGLNTVDMINWSELKCVGQVLLTVHRRVTPPSLQVPAQLAAHSPALPKPGVLFRNNLTWAKITATFKRLSLEHSFSGYS